MSENFTLQNLTDVLERAFTHMDPKLCQDIVVTVGDTGCGKSTLLGALIMGPENLCTVKKKIGGRVIDYKSGVTGPFAIGHEL